MMAANSIKTCKSTFFGLKNLNQLRHLPMFLSQMVLGISVGFPKNLYCSFFQFIVDILFFVMSYTNLPYNVEKKIWHKIFIFAFNNLNFQIREYWTPLTSPLAWRWSVFSGKREEGWGVGGEERQQSTANTSKQSLKIFGFYLSFI